MNRMPTVHSGLINFGLLHTVETFTPPSLSSMIHVILQLLVQSLIVEFGMPQLEAVESDIIGTDRRYMHMLNCRSRSLACDSAAHAFDQLPTGVAWLSDSEL